jgi:hypothetical protein
LRESSLSSLPNLSGRCIFFASIMKYIMLASLLSSTAAFTAPGATRTAASRYAATMRSFSGSSSLFANPKGTYLSNHNFKYHHSNASSSPSTSLL